MNNSLEVRLLEELQEAVQANKFITKGNQGYIIHELSFAASKHNSFEKFRTVYWIEFMYNNELVSLEGDYWDIYNFLKESYEAQRKADDAKYIHKRNPVFIPPQYPRRILMR